MCLGGNQYAGIDSFIVFATGGIIGSLYIGSFFFFYKARLSGLLLENDTSSFTGVGNLVVDLFVQYYCTWGKR